MAGIPTKSQVVHLTACPLCEEGRLESVPAPPVSIGSEVFDPIAGDIALSRCLACRLVFINPRPSEQLLTAFYDRDGYDCHNPHFASDWAESDQRARFSLLDSHAHGKELLLDVGAGAGHLLRYAIKQGWRKVAGIEIGTLAREELRAAGIAVYPDINSARELAGKVDAVTMIQVLEHLAAPHEVLKSIGQLLRPDALLLVEVPNADSLRARLAKSLLKPLWTTNAERYLAFPIHLLYFNAYSFQRLLEQTGFRVLSLGTIGMGVEELRSHPQGSSPAPGVAGITWQTAQGGSARVPRTAKTAIKSLTSTLRLGEQLIAVCRKV